MPTHGNTLDILPDGTLHCSNILSIRYSMLQLQSSISGLFAQLSPINIARDDDLEKDEVVKYWNCRLALLPILIFTTFFVLI